MGVILTWFSLDLPMSRHQPSFLPFPLEWFPSYATCLDPYSTVLILSIPNLALSSHPTSLIGNITRDKNESKQGIHPLDGDGVRST